MSIIYLKKALGVKYCYLHFAEEETVGHPALIVQPDGVGAMT